MFYLGKELGGVSFVDAVHLVVPVPIKDRALLEVKLLLRYCEIVTEVYSCATCLYVGPAMSTIVSSDLHFFRGSALLCIRFYSLSKPGYLNAGALSRTDGHHERSLAGHVFGVDVRTITAEQVDHLAISSFRRPVQSCLQYLYSDQSYADTGSAARARLASASSSTLAPPQSPSFTAAKNFSRRRFPGLYTFIFSRGTSGSSTLAGTGSSSCVRLSLKPVAAAGLATLAATGERSGDLW